MLNGVMLNVLTGAVPSRPQAVKPEEVQPKPQPAEIRIVIADYEAMPVVKTCLVNNGGENFNNGIVGAALKVTTSDGEIFYMDQNFSNMGQIGNEVSITLEGERAVLVFKDTQTAIDFYQDVNKLLYPWDQSEYLLFLQQYVSQYCPLEDK
ncbi:MAG: hypothetical protein WCV91_05110 [Candidatus Margulisiibacteriota bacterium]